MGGKHLDIGEWGTISTFQRDGTWYARGRYRNENGIVRPHDLSGSTARAARTALRRQFERWSDGEGSQISGRSKVSQAVQLHFAYIQTEVEVGRRSPGTRRTYDSVWRNHLEPAIRGWKLREVDAQRIDKMLARISKTAGEQTAKTCRALLSAGLKEALRYKAIAFNPVRDARPTPMPRRQEPKALTREQVQELLHQLRFDPVARRQDVPDLVLWMLTTSERIGNCLAAEWSRIDMESAEAKLGPIVVRAPGGLVKRDADVSSKTRSRTVVLPNATMRMLRARRLAQPLGSPWVFPHSGNEQGLRDPSNTSRALRAAMDRAGFPWVTAHVFRKTVATALDDARVQTRIVSDYLGHSKETQTTGDYFKRRADAPQIRAALDDFVGDEGGAEVVDLAARREA